MHLVFTLGPGGMEHGVVKIVNGLDPERVVSSICSTTAADAGMRARVRAGVPLIELNRRNGNDPGIIWAISRAVRRQRPEILHTHGWGTLVEGLLAGRLARVPAVVHGEHGTLQLRSRQVAAQRWAWRRADGLLSVSSRLAERMSQEIGIPRERIHVIRNGVHFGRFAGPRVNAARASFGLPGESGLVLGAVGRLVDVKDHANLIDAVAVLRQRGRDVMAVIAGDGPLRAALLAQIARLGLERHVRLLGHRADVEAVFAGIDVFVQPSKSEGMSNTILEAMASGLPAIATHVGGADEMVIDGETGILVPPADSGQLANAIDRLLPNKALRHAMGSAARVRARDEFSLEHMVEGYQSFYCDLMQRKMPLARAVGA